MTEYRFTTADFMEEFGLSRKTIRKRAAVLRIGINREGRAGFLYSEADRAKFKESMRPVVMPAPRKRKRAA